MITSEEFHIIYQQGEEATFSLFLQMFDAMSGYDERIHDLEVKSKKNSQNSSKPPSTDGFNRPPRSLRKKTGKKSGGQPGHQGKTLQMVDQPDDTIIHAPENCSQCGHDLHDVEPIKTEQGQVHDIPPVKLVVTAHLRHHKVCPCCQSQEKGEFPEGVRPGAQYGPSLKSKAVYFQYAQFVPSERTAEIFSELFETQISEGSLLNFLNEASEQLEPVEQKIKETLIESPRLHLDETGMRVLRKLYWVHVASNAFLTYYFHHAKRGQKAIDAIDILPQFKGVAIHDCWASYLSYDNCLHALCLVHISRELKGLWENTKQSWVRRMLNFLYGLKRHVARAKAAGRSGFSPHELDRYEAVYKRIVSDGQSQNPASPPSGKRGKTKQSDAFNLLKRFRVYQASMLRFAYDFNVPFDNNLAERDVRMVKLRQKISGCFRSEEGASMFCRIRGYISTLRKQGYSVLIALESVFNHQPYMPKLVAV